MQPEAAAQQMLIEQVRRLTDTVDRLNMNLTAMQNQLARMEAEHAHTVERREKNEAWLRSVDKRVDALEAWRSEQKGERGTIAVILSHPITMAIVGAVVGVLTAIKGGLLK
jgi:hypothetical protein